MLFMLKGKKIIENELNAKSLWGLKLMYHDLDRGI